MRGPFYLDSFSKPINIIAIFWVSLITVLFVLPPLHPVIATNMNYASVGVGAIVLLSGLGYFISARHWFKGPITNLEPNEKEPDVVMVRF